jgi:hypothetical protein
MTVNPKPFAPTNKTEGDTTGKTAAGQSAPAPAGGR